MVRKERGIVRKKTEAPSGMLRNIFGVLRGPCRSDKESDIKDL
jgi:hypothetical protein